MEETIGALMTDIARLLRRRFDERARAIGVTRAQWRVLLVLSRNEGEHQGALAELLDVEPITLCRMIDRLADTGMVERRRDPGDRRRWRIFLTDASRPLIGQLQAIAGGVAEDALDGLDAATRATLDVSLHRVRANLGAHPAQRENAHG